MAALSTIAMVMTAAGAVNQFGEQRRAAKVAEQQGNAEAGLFEQNATLADAQAQDAVERGNQGASQVERSASQLAGEQRVAFAAQGLSLDAGNSTSDVIANDLGLSALDATTIRHNAAREAWGFQTQAVGYRQQGEWARYAGRNAARGLRNQSVGTLISGAGELARIWATAPKGPNGGGIARKLDFGNSTYGKNGMFNWAGWDPIATKGTSLGGKP